MLFPTTDFAIFFGIVFLGHWLLQPTPTRWKLFMIAASYVFYGWWDWHYLWLLALSSALAQAGAVAVHRSTNDRRRRWVMGISVAAVLSLLAYYKYYDFFLTNVANGLHRIGLDLSPPIIALVFPVGLSFYTFMAISYIVDVYRREIEPAPTLDLFVYLSFFPLCYVAIVLLVRSRIGKLGLSLVLDAAVRVSDAHGCVVDDDGEPF